MPLGTLLVVGALRKLTFVKQEDGQRTPGTPADQAEHDARAHRRREAEDATPRIQRSRRHRPPGVTPAPGWSIPVRAMAKAHDSWKVLPHGPLEPLADGLWRVEGSLDTMPLKRVMAIVRRADGRLIIHNAIALDDAGMAALDRLGEVGAIVVPNGWHRLDAAVFHRRYPGAAILCPPGSRKKVAEVVPVSATFDRVEGDGEVSFEVVDGTRGLEGAIVIRRADGTSVVLCDALFNMPHLPGLQGLVLKHLTRSSGGPRVSRIARLLLIKDKPAYGRYLEHLAALPDLRRVLVAHHETIVDRPAETLRRIAATLA